MQGFRDYQHLKRRVFSGAVPEVQNFNCSAPLVQTIVDVQWGVEKPTNVRMSLDGSADVRKGLQKIDVVEKIAGELLSCFGMQIPRSLEDFFQVG